MSRSGAEVEVRHLTWQPLSRREPVLDDIHLTVGGGDRVLLVGPSGSGKSTLLRAIAGVLLTAASGRLDGDVLVDGHAALDTPGLVGLVQQDPTGSVVAETVGRDVAFGLENLRLPRAEMPSRVSAALAEARFPYGPGRSTGTLSGGESQRLSIAGALAMQPRLLLLDEPTSMLDPIAAAAVRTELQRLVMARNATAVVVAHHLDGWLGFATRLVVLGRGGRVIADGTPKDVFAERGADLAAEGVWVPGLPPPQPLAVDPRLVVAARVTAGELLSVDDVVVRRRAGRHVGAPKVDLAFPAVDATLRTGNGLALTGPSGAGKSTMLGVLAGLLTPAAAHVRVMPGWGPKRRGEQGPWRWASRDLARRMSWVAQLPEHGIVTGRVDDEVLATSHAIGDNTATAAERAVGLLQLLGLDHLATASPYHLSGGEQRRLALAAALAHGPDALLLDEPTVGQDRLTWAVVTGVCLAARTAGLALVVATHDELAVRAAADRRIGLGGP